MRTGGRVGAVPDAVATETVTRDKRFLEAAAGNTVKERANRTQEAARKGGA